MKAFDKVNTIAQEYRHSELWRINVDNHYRALAKMEIEEELRTAHAANIRNYAKRATIVFGCRMEG
jgi:hypothetical protein